MLLSALKNSNFKQEQFICYAFQGRNIFLTGSAGTGKTFALKTIIDILPYKIAVLAWQGITAYNIKGRTICNFLGFKSIIPTNQWLENVSKNSAAIKRIQNVEILIIDEISLISSEILDTLDNIFKSVKGSKFSFGGIQVIFVGDFLQIPPINGDFAFNAKCWSSLFLNIIELKENIRQNKNKEFINSLNKIRLGVVDENTKRLLLSRCVKPNYEELNGIIPTCIVSKISDVQRINFERLHNLKKPIYFNHPKVSNNLHQNSIFELFSTNSYCIDAQIMLTTNINVSSGLCNGTRGIITEVTKDIIYMKLLTGKIIPIKRYKYIYNDIVEVYQFPIKLAWAISIHKSQGVTLDCAEIYIGKNIFDYGMTYVALSRVKDINNLYIRRLDFSKIKANPTALTFNQHIHNVPYN